MMADESPIYESEYGVHFVQVYPDRIYIRQKAGCLSAMTGVPHREFTIPAHQVAAIRRYSADGLIIEVSGGQSRRIAVPDQGAAEEAIMRMIKG